MAVRGDVTVNWAVSPRVIEVASPSTDISIQDLVDTCRTFEAELDNLDDNYLINATGKEDLGGGVQVGITLILNNARVKFEDRPSAPWTNCTVSGGNLLAKDIVGDFIDPVEPAAYVTVTIAQSSSATISESDAADVANAVWDKSYSSVSMKQRLIDIYELYGLDPSKPLIVTEESRTAGDIYQEIEETPSNTRVVRIP